MTVNREDLKAYIDGELKASASEEFQREISRDEELAKEAAFMRILGSGIRELAAEPRAHGAEELLARFAKPRPSTLPVFAFGAACLVGLMLVGANLNSRSLDLSNDSLLAVTRNDSVHVAAKAFDRSKAVSAVSASSQSSAVNVARRSHGVMFKQGTDDAVDQGRSAAKAVPSPGLRDQVAPENPDPSRMVVEKGELTEEVNNVASAENDASDYVKSVGGYVQNSDLTNSQGETPEASLTVWVPSNLVAESMKYFKSLAIDAGHIESFHMSGQDVTEQYSDASGSMEDLGAREDDYVEQLRNARGNRQKEELRDRISDVRDQIQSLRSTKKVLRKTSQMSRIDLTLVQFERDAAPVHHESHPSWSSGAWGHAASGLSEVLRLFGILGIYLFVYSPVWLPLGLIGIWLYRRSR